MRRFELVEGGSAKFWEVAVSDATLTVRYGRIGTQGQTQSKVFADAGKASAERDKLVREKTGKGYVEQAVDAGAGLAAVAPKATTTTPPSSVQAAPAPAAVSAPVVAAAAPTPAAVAKVAVTATPAPPAPPAAFAIATDPGPEPRPPGVFLWQPQWRALLAPFHGEVESMPAPLDVEAVAAELRARLTDARDALAPRFAAAPAASGQPAAAPLDLSTLPDRLRSSPPDAGAWLQLYTALAAEAERSQRVVTLALAWKLALGWHGPAFALKVFLAFAEHTPLSTVQRFLVNQKLMQSHDFQLRLAALPADDYQALLASLPEPDTLHTHALLALAALLPGEMGLARAALARMVTLDVSDGELPGLLMHCRMPIPMAWRLLELAGQTRWLGGWAWQRFTLNLLRLEFQLEAMKAMQGLAKRMVDGDQLRDYFALRRGFDTAQALALLFTAHGRKEAQAAIDEFANAWPELSLRLMAQQLAAKSDAPGRDWLAQFARAHTDALPLAAARCEGAAREVLVTLARKLGPARAEAALDDLPDWLRAPPWRVKGRKARPAFPKLGSEPAAAQWLWQDGELDRWMEGRSLAATQAWYTQHWAGLSMEPAAVLGHFGFDAATVHALVTRSEAPVWPPRGWRMHFPDMLIMLPQDIAVRLLGARDVTSWYDMGTPLEAVVAWLGDTATPAVEAIAERHTERGLQLAQPLASARIASVAAHGLRSTRRAKAPAQRWLLRHAQFAATCLLPRLSESAGSADAAHALRWLLANGHDQAVATAAGRFGADGTKAYQLLVAFDPMQLAPLRIPALPEFWTPAGFARPALLDGRILPAEVLDAIGQMLAFSSLDQRYEGITRLRALCTPRSLGAFAQDLFQNWLRCGAPMKEQWAFAALAQIGDDDCAHALAKLLRVWPSEGAFGRAVAGLDVLAGFGSEVALMLLHGISQKVKSKPLQAKAQACLAQLAEVRGLDAQQLADRLVPDLDLADDGTLRLDFGPRAFTVGFDEHLKPQVVDADGKPLKDLPAPNNADDPTLAEAATTAWKALKKNVRTLASTQIQRLENAMVQQRRWSAEEFQRYFVEHPLLRHLVRRLLWAVIDPTDGRVLHGLRVAEDLSFADHQDALLTLAEDAVIGLPHPLELSAEQLAAFGQVFADYEIAQPFAQLGREVFQLTDEEAAGTELKRFEGKKVATGSVFGLLERGWQRSDHEGGWLGGLERPAGGNLRTALILNPGAPLGDTKTHPVQTLESLKLFSRSGYEPLPWQRATPILVSESLRDVAKMAVVKG